MLFDWLIVLALIFLNALFAAAEIAILSVRKSRVAELVEKGSQRARALAGLRSQPERFLATVQIGITIVSATAAVFGAERISWRVEGWLTRHGVAESAHTVTLAFVVVGVSFLSLVIGELVPKSLALRFAEPTALAVARPLAGLSQLARPVVWVIVAASNLILKLFGDSTTFTESRISPEELQQMVEEAARQGALDPKAGEIASRAFDFGSLLVGDCMVPRRDVVTVPRRAQAEELRRVLLEEGHSRMPVTDGSVDKIVGYVIAKDILAMSWEKDLIVLEDILRPVMVVPETRRAVDVLTDLRRKRTQLAIVVDETGQTAGVVTIEDLVEELVGDIVSEHDVPEELVRREPGGTALVQASTPIRDVNRELGLTLPESDEFSTIAGLCIELAGWIPSPRQVLETPSGTRIEVVEASPRRVRMVRIHPPAPPKSSTPAAPAGQAPPGEPGEDSAS